MTNSRAAVTTLFFLNGVVFSSFFARLPAVKDDLDASDGQLGLALFLATAGLVAAQPLAGLLVVRRGGRVATLVGTIGYAAGLPLAALAPSIELLAFVLFSMGLTNGILDVAINVEGAALERRGGKRMLASMHAAFSFGAMAGAGGGALAAAAGLDPAAHLTVVMLVVFAAAAFAWAGLPANDGATSTRRAFARPSRRLLALGAVAFCVLLAEGSVTDWSAVFLNDEAGASEALAAVGLTAFSLAMAVGRLGGDQMAGRFGPVAVVCFGGALAAIGLGAALATAEPAVGIAGFAVMGIGLAAGFPLVVASAARADENEEAAAIAAVSGVGYVGLMAGPATIGLLAEAGSLRTALVLVVVLCAAAAALAGSLRATPTRP